ncbi:ABC transporter substrate-binding protein [Pseudokineococcus marinus]|uniref:ABC transporter substrate-binding protein n=2 Tax=Pseudokineococcus marinus TaxID=351215 RepID=A0A849BMH9_9ACTN|nr:ABC transporter substrate-binding protein [Pseudokineococcus marinus]NNH22002.1 ABC transporter substrate-binding protein [Pseudokineococcus marinus]
MRVPTRTTRAMAIAMAGVFALSACGGSDDGGSGDGATGGGAGNPDATWSMYIGQPENPLVPGNTSETEGGQVVDSLWTGLVQYSREDTSVEYTGVAESIESDDQQNWTITLKDGWTFHDGTPVTASSFVDAWNYTALSDNAQQNSYFFSNIEGYDALQAETDDEGNVVAPPTATEMSGLEVVDDQTFTVALTSPFTQYPLTLGYTAFYPMSQAFLDDPEAMATDTPIGNGPFMAEAPLSDGQGIDLVRFDDYAGEDAAQSGGVSYRIYTDVNTAYNDVQGGNLDLVDSIPPDAIASAQDVFGDRYLESPSSSFQYLGYPLYDPRFQDVRVRQAMSMAIDRQAISDAIFQGSRTPADDFVSPVVNGYREGACEYCQYDPEAAKALLAETDFDTSQPIELWFNNGAGHDAWVQAVGNQLRDNLGVDYTLRGDLDFSQYLPLGDDQGFTGPFRSGWVMDYPSMQNYLESLFSTGAQPPAGSNNTFYSNPDFDALLQEANSAPTDDEAVELYQQADDVLLEDMPAIPMFFSVVQSVWSENISDVYVDPFTRVDAAAVTVNS